MKDVTMKVPHNHDIAIGFNIRRIRMDASLSQKQLGEKLEPMKSYQQIQKYESGKSRVIASVLVQIAIVLGKAPAEFFVGTGTAGLPSAVMPSAQALDLARYMKEIPPSDVKSALIVMVKSLANHFRSPESDAPEEENHGKTDDRAA